MTESRDCSLMPGKETLGHLPSETELSERAGVVYKSGGFHLTDEMKVRGQIWEALMLPFCTDVRIVEGSQRRRHPIKGSDAPSQ